MLNIILKAIRLDVVGMLPDLSDPDLYYRNPPQNCRERLRGGSRAMRLYLFLRRMAGTFRPISGEAPNWSRSVLLAAFTLNQWRALEPIFAKLEICGANPHFLDARQKAGLLRHLERRAFLWALPFFPLVLVRTLTSRGYQRRSFRWGIDRYWLAYGAYVAIRRWLRSQPPRTVVVSNDHTFWPRIFVAAAQDEGIPTIYVQHAPVTERFPPLMMDYALLEGQQSLRTYASIGKTATRAYLVGMPRLDAHVGRINRSGHAHTVGFCLGPDDFVDRASELLRHITSACPDLRFVLRLHPRSAAQAIEHCQDLCRELRRRVFR